MFGNINNRQKPNEQPADKNVREENLLEQKQPQVQPMGNEAANVNPFTQIIRMANLETGNEFLAGLEDEEEAGDLSGVGENINNENNISNIDQEDNKEEAFLKINRFTDFYLLDETADPQVWAAVMELRFYRI